MSIMFKLYAALFGVWVTKMSKDNCHIYQGIGKLRG